MSIAFSGIARSQEIITSSGDYFTTVNGSLSVTIGEPITETFVGGANILTQGFQQSRLKVLGIYESPETDFDITVFPNPVQDKLTVKIGKFTHEQFSYKLFDLQGKMLDHHDFEPPETLISFQNLVPSVYFLRIYSFDTLSGTYKIVKQ